MPQLSVERKSPDIERSRDINYVNSIFRALLGSVYLRVTFNLSYTLLGNVYLTVIFNLSYTLLCNVYLRQGFQ